MTVDGSDTRQIARPPERADDADRVVAYVTDPGFLVPTLVSAEAVRLQLHRTVDVVVATTGMTAEEHEALAPIAATLGLVSLRMDGVALPDGARWARGHVPPATLGRFLLPRYLDHRYRHVLYIDGDTQIVGDIRPLAAVDVPCGMVGAVPDLSVLDFRKSRFPRGYFERLGISDPARYFNAGVLAFERATFDEAMAQAMSFFLAHSDLCRYHDQSALNAVMNGRLFALSPRYNLLSTFQRAGVAGRVPPVLIHFNGADKPWQAEDGVWKGRFRQPYLDMVRRFPELAPYLRAIELREPKGGRPPGGGFEASAAAGPLRAAARAYRRWIFGRAMRWRYDLP